MTLREDKEYSYRVRPGDPTYLMARRCQKQLGEIKAGLDRLEVLEHEQTLESLRRCEILELQSEIEFLRWELREAQRSRR